MQTARDLQNQLRNIDHKSYPAYKDCGAVISSKVMNFISIMCREIRLRLPHMCV